MTANEVFLKGITLVKKLMFSALKNTANYSVIEMFSVLKTLIGYEKYIKIHQGNAVYFKRTGSLLAFHCGNVHFRLIPPKIFSLG
jgi:hypothetical protein